jgi:hypothetical protein
MSRTVVNCENTTTLRFSARSLTSNLSSTTILPLEDKKVPVT